MALAAVLLTDDAHGTKVQRSSSASWARLLGRRPADGPDNGPWFPASEAWPLRQPSPALCWGERGCSSQRHTAFWFSYQKQHDTPFYPSTFLLQPQPEKRTGPPIFCMFPSTSIGNDYLRLIGIFFWLPFAEFCLCLLPVCCVPNLSNLSKQRAKRRTTTSDRSTQSLYGHEPSDDRGKLC